MDIESTDERMVTVQITDKTKKPDHLAAGDKVEVDATQDDKGVFTAATIRKTGSAATQTQAPAKADDAPSQANEPDRPTTTMATPVPLDPDDEGGPPKLKRGKPAPRKSEAAEIPSTGASPATTEVARNGPPPAAVETAPEASRSTTTENSHMASIEKAREASRDFLAALPNYVVQQFTTRYVSSSSGRKADWQAQDVVSCDVIYDNGKERYDHIAVNGKAWKKPVEESGAWSWGEFGTVLEDLFSPATAANFKYAGNRSINRQSASVYDFEVDHPHSHWKIQVPGQFIMPAYRGSVWISRETGRVLRLEMQAVKIPPEFPEDATEMAVDYDYVSLGVDKFLLPVKSEVLSCQRGSNLCSKNTIEFRNYHKYTGESTITFH